MQPQLYRGIRKRSEKTLFGLPLLDIALGPDPEKGEIRGHARGIIAIGGVAVGYYACGAASLGKCVYSAMQRSPEAITFFKHWLPFLHLR